MKQKQKALVFSGLILAYVLFLFLYYEKTVSIMESSTLFVSIFFYCLYNLGYVLLIITLIKVFNKKIWRELTGGISLVVALAMLEMPRLLPGELSNPGAAVSTNMGFIVMQKLVGGGLSETVAYNLYYWILPTLFIIASIYLLGIIRFGKRLENGLI